MASGLIIDYLGTGPIASRPVSLTLHTGALGLWFATDTASLSAWDGSTWTTVTSGSGGTIWGTITGTLSDQTDLQNALDALGDVVGPASSTDGKIALFDGTTGKLLKVGEVPTANRNVVTAVSSTSGTTTCDASLGDYFTTTLSENTTIALSNIPAACTLCLTIIQGAGAYTVTFPVGWDWGEGNTAPTMPTGAGKIMDVIVTTNDSGATEIATARNRA